MKSNLIPRGHVPARHRVADRPQTTPTRPIRIGELAAERGLNPKTIRFYEAIGLLRAPARSAARYRLYGAADRERLHFIVKAKRLGFSLKEIEQILVLREDGEAPCGYVREILDRKLQAADDQMRALTIYRQRLLAVRATPEAPPDAAAAVCAIIERHEIDSTDPLPAHDQLPHRGPPDSSLGGRLDARRDTCGISGAS